MKIKHILCFLLFSISFSQDCSWWQTWIENIPESVNIDEDDDNCFGTSDLERLQEFIDLNESLINFTPIEIGTQSWINNRLTYLNLYSSGIDTIPNSINELSKLQFLYLSANPISYIPESISELDRLERFYIHTCQIQEIPESIGELTRLKKIWIYNNQLTSLPESFGNLEDLEQLKIANNNITVLPESFGNLSKIEELDILNNNLESLPVNFENLTNLNYLNLFNNNLQDFIENISDFEDLQILNLENNSLNFISDQICEIIDSLSFFSINNNYICPPYYECLTEFEIGNQNLQSCELCESNFTLFSEIPEIISTNMLTNCFYQGDISVLSEISLFNNLVSLPPFYNFPQTWEEGRLVELDLSANSIVGIPNNIQNLEALKVLDLSNNSLFFINDTLTNLENLEELNLLNNPLMAIPNSIGNLSNLKSISINSANLDSIPISFGNLDSLQTIFINSTQIKYLPSQISFSPNLETLHLAGNQIEFLPADLCELPDNCVINVANNNLCSEFYFECIDIWNDQNCLSITHNDNPEKYKLLNIHPNPFNSVTTINFKIPEKTWNFISIEIFDINGRFIETLISGNIEPGNHTIKWNAGNYPSSLYFVKLDTGNSSQTQKLMLVE